MSNWAPPQGRIGGTIGLVSAATQGVSVTSAATSSTEGTWTTIGQFSSPMAGFFVEMGQSSPALGAGIVPSTTFDIALGDGSTTLADSIYVRDCGNRSGHMYTWYFPLKVPANVPVVVRMRSETTVSLTNTFALTGYSGGYLGGGLTAIESINVSTSSAATTLDPGGALNTKGTATSLTTGGLPRDYKGLYVYGLKNQIRVATNPFWHFIDILDGTGVIINDLLLTTCTAEDSPYGFYGPIWINLAAGTPLLGRTQSNGSQATQRLLEVALYGIY